LDELADAYEWDRQMNWIPKEASQVQRVAQAKAIPVSHHRPVAAVVVQPAVVVPPAAVLPQTIPTWHVAPDPADVPPAASPNATTLAGLIGNYSLADVLRHFHQAQPGSAVSSPSVPVPPQPKAAPVQPTVLTSAVQVPPTVFSVQDEPTGPLCIFCQENMDTSLPDENESLMCGHVFHVTCINESIRVTHMSKNQICPMKCHRSTIPVDETSYLIAPEGVLCA
jgi:hypothetical protein